MSAPRRPRHTQANRDLVDAIRAWLGLGPLYGTDPQARKYTHRTP